MLMTSGHRCEYLRPALLGLEMGWETRADIRKVGRPRDRRIRGRGVGKTGEAKYLFLIKQRSEQVTLACLQTGTFANRHAEGNCHRLCSKCRAFANGLFTSYDNSGR